MFFSNNRICCPCCYKRRARKRAEEEANGSRSVSIDQSRRSSRNNSGEQHVQNDTIDHLTNANVVTKPSSALVRFMLRRSVEKLDAEV